MGVVSISGKLSVVVEDEQLDNIVIKHLQDAVELCYDTIALAERDIEQGGDYPFLKQDIDDNIKYLEAMNAVIEYFGGNPVYKD